MAFMAKSRWASTISISEVSCHDVCVITMAVAPRAFTAEIAEAAE
jgi:hypothetical protein